MKNNKSGAEENRKAYLETKAAEKKKNDEHDQRLKTGGPSPYKKTTAAPKRTSESYSDHETSSGIRIGKRRRLKANRNK